MEKVPYSKYTKELRLEAVRLVTEGGLSVWSKLEKMDTKVYDNQ